MPKKAKICKRLNFRLEFLRCKINWDDWSNHKGMKKPMLWEVDSKRPEKLRWKDSSHNLLITQENLWRNWRKNTPKIEISLVRDSQLFIWNKKVDTRKNTSSKLSFIEIDQKYEDLLNRPHEDRKQNQENW